MKDQNEKYFDSDELNKRISIDTYLDEKIISLIDQQRKSEIYIRTCNNMIKTYEKKIKVANKKIEDMKKVIEREVRECLKDGFENNFLNIEKDFKETKEGDLIYKIPSAIIYIKKAKPLIIDEDILNNWFPLFLEEIGVEMSIQEFLAGITISNNKMIWTTTGLILENIGLTLSKEEILIKFI